LIAVPASTLQATSSQMIFTASLDWYKTPQTS